MGEKIFGDVEIVLEEVPLGNVVLRPENLS
jgi:hypothetical protein